MIKTLRESKAKLSELVERASQGEDVLITVRGKVKARLTRAAAPSDPSDRQAWIERLKRIQKTYTRGEPKASLDEILSDLRKDRWEE
jgi:prevent-host-death family protein